MNIKNSYKKWPDNNGYFGKFGGRYVAETLMPLILEIKPMQHMQLVFETNRLPYINYQDNLFFISINFKSKIIKAK